MTEDPIKKTHAEDKNLERNFASIQKTKDREEAKGRVRQLKWYPNVVSVIENVQTKRRQVLKSTTVYYFLLSSWYLFCEKFPIKIVLN